MDYSATNGYLLAVVGAVFVACLGAFGVVSVREREPRAATLAFVAAGLVAVALVLLARGSEALREGTVAIFGGLGLFAVLAWLLPIGSSIAGNGRPTRRFDERDIMFARARLKPGTPEHDRYYAMRPEHKAGDDRTRALPGLLSPRAALAEAGPFAAAKDSFRTTYAMRHQVDGPLAPDRCDSPADRRTATIKQRVLELGARDVGVTKLQPYHVYSHVGRGTGTWGEPIELGHRWAVAFTVEMDHQTMRCAPAAPVLAESARQYVAAAEIAVQVAKELRGHGYPARAHIDGNYQVIAPLVARDAGLGELGRMGILMTPKLGPRVRLGVVTTDAPLVADPPGDDLSVIDFCTICRKCAVNCPSESIPLTDREPVDGGLRWAIDADSCFRYWNAIGSDCGRCMTVCPYSHPDNTAHNLVRWACRRSGVARRGALLLDDLFYGTRPKARRPRSNHSPR